MFLKNKNLFFYFIFSFLLVTRPLLAIYGGQKAELYNVVKLVFVGIYTEDGQNAFCSASVVGTHPFTIALASHCIWDGYTQKLLTRYFEVEGEKLSKKRFNVNELKIFGFPDHYKDWSNDLALIVFPFSVDDSEITPWSIAPRLWENSSLTACGFGYDKVESAAGKYGILNCGMLHSHLFASQWIEKFKESSIEEFTEPYLKSFNRDWYLSQLDITNYKSCEPIVSTIAGTDQVKFDLNFSLPNIGDSGGPQGINGHLIAVNSRMISYDIHLLASRFLIFSYAPRFHSPAGQKIVNEALNAGADIKDADLFLDAKPNCQEDNPIKRSENYAHAKRLQSHIEPQGEELLIFEWGN